MNHLRLFATILGCAIVLAASSPGQRGLRAASASRSKEKFTPVNLKPKFNHKLNDNFHDNAFKGNDLKPLPRGKQVLGGVTFFIGDGMIQLGSTQNKEKPAKVDGIEVGQELTRLHILHATGWQAAEDTVIGTYTFHYADKTKASIEIVYGKDVRDWWKSEDTKETSRGKVAWEGQNEAVKGLANPNVKIRLFLTTWENPYPRKKVVKVDYAATTEKIKAAPFCVAMTAEQK